MKDLPNIIELQLLAVDFKDTSFVDNSDCAVSKACKRQLDIIYASASTTYVKLNDKQDKYYFDSRYGAKQFNPDRAQAHDAKPNTVIRTLTLTKS